MASMDKAQPLDETTDPESSPGITSNSRSTNVWVVYPVDGFPTDGTHPLQQLLESFGPQSVTKLHEETSTIIGIMFWTLLLTPSELKMLEESSLVRIPITFLLEFPGHFCIAADKL
ncbi:hypothetical protein BOTNAR_0131g00300 [Botryotinia narcissicola]|uniref:Uncharacterized protein n=1 Tax=Botryotinia narcissicola TaxID=278944 RepID=A0A4Z1IPB3_9HELO|nr:hypothetical protein BOTNAR_0131g00300 [Botryotinia narcissicola]